MGVLLELSARRRGEIIRSAALLALAVGFGAFAETPGSAPAATTPAIGNALENPASPAVLDRAREPLRPAPGEPVPIGNPLWAIPLSSLSAARERPIFSPSRRPPPPAVIAAPYVPPVSPPPPKPPEPDHPLLTLLGTVAGEAQGIGIFINQIDKTPMHLKTGEGHEGWVLRSVSGREVIFEKNNRTATLVLPPRGSADQTRALPVPAPVGNAWRDGDGQMISPPRRAPSPVVAAPTVAAAAVVNR